MSQSTPDHNHLRVLIETMQRAGVPEEGIHRAVRHAAGEGSPRRRRRLLRLLPGRRPPVAG
jgi:transcriptional/translational regulatory protein YebC/TACO1